MGSRTSAGGVLVGIVALVGAAAACQPVAPPPPPPPPQATCDTASQPAPSAQSPVSYVAIVAPKNGAAHQVTVFTATSPADRAAKLAQLQQSDTVLSVAPNRVVSVADAPINTTPPNYPDYALQWGLHGAPGGDFAPAWNTSLVSGQGVTVAVVDTGVDLNHVGLVGHVVAGPDFYDDASGQTLVSGDVFGHGTHVAGIIADNDPAGGLGGAPRATILALEVLGPQGSGSSFAVAQGIEWAAQHGASVINLSLGDVGCDPTIQQALIDAHTDGVVVAAAAGNSDSNQLFSPAGYTNEVIAVAALNPSGQKASFSDWGPYVSIAAPGEQVLSTCAYTGCIGGTPSDAAYGYLSGTSMATPFVAAAAALVKEECPEFHTGPGEGRAGEPCGRRRARVLVPEPRRRPGGRRRLPLTFRRAAPPGSRRRSTPTARSAR